MDEVNVLRIVWGESNLDSAVQVAMIKYGHGYDSLVYMHQQDDTSGYMLVATEDVQVDEDVVDLVNEYYEGTSSTNKVVAGSKTLALEDTIYA
jgi:hypothetical protein